ncbi:PLP-dependent transferase [Martelella mediterranea]|uniref:PLP-dependent transferase n=1 Tax=Martelella mediterranea TaxID=293089 RepID=UPI001F1645E4|nr:PLP-dependent transferase [Martelella mediterranea]
MHPALESFPGHALWKREFLGSSGVFSVVFCAAVIPHIAAARDALEIFAIDASWGGTRSLRSDVL